MALTPKYDSLLDDIREKDLGYGTADNPFPSTGRYFYDTSGILWVETIDTSGHLVTTVVANVTMVGPWLSLGLTNIEHS